MPCHLRFLRFLLLWLLLLLFLLVLVTGGLAFPKGNS